MLYFVKYNRNRIKIEDWPFEITNPRFTKFTQEQETFYADNPNASIEDVVNTNNSDTIIRPIEEVRSLAIERLVDIKYSIIGSIIDMHSVYNIIANNVANARPGRPVKLEASTIRDADNYIVMSNRCEEVFNTYKESILNASTTEAVENLLGSAEEALRDVLVNPNTIEQAKLSKLRELDMYDSSSDVNGFFYNDILLWIDKNMRSALVNTINSAEMLNRDRIRIWYNGLYIDLGLEEARVMLAQIEMYASECYSTTQQHRNNIVALTSVQSIENYDVTANYPQRLTFNTIQQ